jgi:phage terminase large subunit GpA-like protein
MTLQTSAQLAPAVLAVFQGAAKMFEPPPRLTLTEWAEEHCVLSSEDSAEPGRYRVARAPYQRGMQDAVLDPRVEEVVLFTSAQVGKTQVEKNILAYFIAEDPSAILMVLPEKEGAKRYASQRLAPMIRDTKKLRELVIEGHNRAGSGALQKFFPGGVLFVVSANIPSALSSMPARVVMTDEEDRFGESAGDEGNPVQLAKKRQTTFWNRKLIRASTTTIRGMSSIEAAYENSNKQRYQVPCPHCGEFQVLKWKAACGEHRLVFPPKDEAPTAENVFYACEHCGVLLTEFDKPGMLARGKWVAERPEVKHVAGFWINELYSPFVAWHEMVANWREVIAHREDTRKLQTFINLSLAESWEETAEVLDGSELMQRREDYPPPALPDGVTVLTCGVDVQDDRLELEVVGWGKGEESWSIERLRFEGDTAALNGRDKEGQYLPSCWEKLEEFLTRTEWLHARGVKLKVVCTFIDSGFRAREVYSFTQAMQQKGLRIFASKGISGFGRAPLQKFNKNNRARVRMYPVGVDVLKETIYGRLKLQAPGAGYMHFSRGISRVSGDVVNDADYFNELTAEVLRRKYMHGFPQRFWEKKPGARNESLDCRVYGYAAFLSLSEKPEKMLERLREELVAWARQMAEARRAKVNPDQLALLDMDAEDGATEAVGRRSSVVGQEEKADSYQPEANSQEREVDHVADAGKMIEAPAAPAVPETEEYKVAEALDRDAAPAAAEPDSRRVIVRKRKWL